MPVYRGGAKFQRALESVRGAEQFFKRVIISLNSPLGSPDEKTTEDFRTAGDTRIEVIQTGEGLPWIPLQFFRLDYLENWRGFEQLDDVVRPRRRTQAPWNQ